MKNLYKTRLHYRLNPITLREQILALIEQHGGVRKAARAVQVDPGYFVKLRDGKQTEPSDVTLRRLGLRKMVTYETLYEKDSL